MENDNQQTGKIQSARSLSLEWKNKIYDGLNDADYYEKVALNGAPDVIQFIEVKTKGNSAVFIAQARIHAVNLLINDFKQIMVNLGGVVLEDGFENEIKETISYVEELFKKSFGNRNKPKGCTPEQYERMVAQREYFSFEKFRSNSYGEIISHEIFFGKYFDEALELLGELRKKLVANMKSTLFADLTQAKTGSRIGGLFSKVANTKQ